MVGPDVHTDGISYVSSSCYMIVVLTKTIKVHHHC